MGLKCIYLVIYSPVLIYLCAVIRGGTVFQELSKMETKTLPGTQKRAGICL